MNNQNAADPRVGPAVRGAAPLPSSIKIAIEQVRTSVNSMDVVLHGLELDRNAMPDGTADNLVRQRWATQFTVIANMFWDIEHHVAQLEAELDKLATAPDRP